mmetsp:Transcript_63337/g.151102  ORF Transcript_63337/g.151102 Transcript_63337/m.151102 type:complete len:541 (-) Transcript_63337:223-1845(-)|eukprot:CAMPEP_0178402824 /NCGR_PEP_ID=MMETSP0689_2-20121128/17049_1 /TAXON_ID=160604 /ORGANISM="Amphidinium massartii, Strain CS-259" /LENGTH=540 /DNA_ID=CAMNT_0020023753 /DNA_START=125 /DNA_END=1747 /DNA_ORIENTATION=-
MSASSAQQADLTSRNEDPCDSLYESWDAGYDPQVCVKNTFITPYECPPDSGDVRRASTAPSRTIRGTKTLVEGDDEDEDSLHPPMEEEELLTGAPTALPPESGPICRDVTEENWPECLDAPLLQLSQQSLPLGLLAGSELLRLGGDLQQESTFQADLPVYEGEMDKRGVVLDDGSFASGMAPPPDAGLICRDVTEENWLPVECLDLPMMHNVVAPEHPMPLSPLTGLPLEHNVDPSAMMYMPEGMQPNCVAFGVPVAIPVPVPIPVVFPGSPGTAAPTVVPSEPTAPAPGNRSVGGDASPEASQTALPKPKPVAVPHSKRASGPTPPLVPQGQQVKVDLEGDGLHRVAWTVDGKKLRQSDKQFVSPTFTLRRGTAEGDQREVPFTMMLFPATGSASSSSATGNPNPRKGGGSFAKARGRVHLRLKCQRPEDLADAADMRLRAAVTQPDKDAEEAMCEPVHWDFAEAAVCVIGKNGAEQEWDLSATAEMPMSQSLHVVLEIATPEAFDAALANRPSTASVETPSPPAAVEEPGNAELHRSE